MPKSTKEEKYRWIKPILDKEISIKDMVKVCPFSERSLKYWLAAFNKFGINGLENKSRRPKTNPKETPIRIKERIIELRKEKNECALKIQWDLEDEGINIHHQTIQKIIRQEGLTRKYRTRKIKYNYVRIPLKRGELIEIDVKWVPDRIKGQRSYQFTAIKGDASLLNRVLGFFSLKVNQHPTLINLDTTPIISLSISATNVPSGKIFILDSNISFEAAPLSPHAPF